jgi:hypothetical protein
MRTMNLYTDAELESVISGQLESLEELAPYADTQAGAQAITEVRETIARAKRLLEERGEVDPRATPAAQSEYGLTLANAVRDAREAGEIP